MRGYVEPEITEYLFQKAVSRKRPISATFELSPVCNFHCKMCYVRQDRKLSELKPPSFWIDLARQAHDAGVLYLLLTGGEPFLYPGFWEVYEAVSAMGMIISINSNGSLITEEVVNRLKKRPPSRINITLYGASHDTYGKLCGAPDAYPRVLKAIRMLKDSGISVKLNCSLTPSNQADMAEIIKYAEREKLILEMATYMFPPIRLDSASCGRNHRFTAEEMAANDMQILHLQRGKEYRDCYAEKIINTVNEEEMDVKAEPCEEGDGVRCRAGRAIFWTTWDGKITPCGMMPTPAVPLENLTLEQAWEELYKSTQAIRLAPECKSCKSKSICHVCAGMVYAENGAFDKKPEYLCQYVKELKHYSTYIIKRGKVHNEKK